MSKQYRKSGQIDVYEPVPPKNNSWVGGALLIFVILCALAQCGHH